MSQHEVEVKPYGTKNEIDTRYTSGTSGRTGDASDYNKPPYGQKNEAATGVSVTAQAPPSHGGSGSRADVEVRPLGMADTSGLNKTTASRTVSNIRQQLPAQWEQWKNPLLATLLGITLALTLLSLSYVPRAITGAWHWGTSWLPGMHSDKIQQTYDNYDANTKSYMHDLAQPRKDESLYQRGKDMYNQAGNVAQNVKQTGDSLMDRVKHTGERILHPGREMVQETKEMYNQRIDQASNVAQNVKETGDSLMDRVKQTGERILHPMGGSSLAQEAKQMACYRAQQATDMACQGVDMRSWSNSGSNMMQQARDTANDAQYRAQGVFEQAKQRASDILEHAKDTVTYPVHAAGERLTTVRETVGTTAQTAAEQAQNVAGQARDSTYSTLQAAKDRVGNVAENAKDTVLGAGEAVKDTVLGAGQAAKDTVLGAGEAVKDTVLGAGQAAKNMASNTASSVKDTVSHATTTSNERTTVTDNHNRGQTRVKVEVQEL